MPHAQKDHTNRLIHATSPYLLQHAHNPVDWYEWGEQAFARAQEEDKPIFLSIGYSACHWCHVMAHESFENERVAEYLNANFVNVKVDREERPDVDEIYMHVTQLLNQGQGGWPMSLFLTPQREPIFAGTYLPPDQLLVLAQRIHDIWTSERDKVDKQTEVLRSMLDQWAAGAKPDDTAIALGTVDMVARTLASYIDRSKGGFRTEGNKFPPSMAMELMLRVHRRTGDADLLAAVETTLDQMARGGIYDQLGGGICRYSTDPDWLVPHFEKMLYDQALVSAIYLDAYLVTHDKRYANVARDIFDYVTRDLQSPEGGFYSTRDADSEGLEGAYYVWTVEQVQDALGPEEAALFCKYYDVTESGNWFEPRGHAPAGPKNILHVSKPPATFAKLHGLSVEELESKVATWRRKMLDARAKRVPPGLDDKILTAWNGLMISSLATGARVLGEPKYAEAASRAAGFILDNLQRDGRLLRTYRDGKAQLSGYLSDYAFFIEGLIDLYEATFERRWLDQAAALNEQVLRRFRDDEKGGFFFTADDAERLIARTKNPHDGAIPSGNSVQAMNLLRLAAYFDRHQYRQVAEGTLRAFKPLVGESPAQFERLLCVADMYHDRVKEVAIIGDRSAPETAALVAAVFADFVPNKIVAQADPGASADGIAILKGKTAIGGKPTAYLCENNTCRPPVHDPAALRQQLSGP